MKKLNKKILSVFLAMLLLTALFTPVFALQEEKGGEIPIVYVLGKVDVLYKDKTNPNSKTIYPVSIEDALNKDLISDLGAPLMKALEFELMSNSDSTEAWNDYAIGLYNIIANIYKDLFIPESQLAADGSVLNGSGIIWDNDWENQHYNNGKNILTDTKDENGCYGLYDYTFHYDWRLDMYYNSDILNDYIDDVLEVTGSDKCVLISRCYGCNLVATYLNKYGCDKIDNCIIYCSTAAGSIVCSEMFSGNFCLNSDGMDIYLKELFGINPFTSIINESISKYVPKSVSSKFVDIVNLIYTKVGNVMMPKTLISSFASMPGYWSMVEEDNFYYDDAKEFVFGDGKDHSRIINLIDYEHYTVTCRAAEIFKKAQEKGMKFANVVKYGNQITPMIKSCDLLGDGIVEVASASMGGTSVKIDETLPTEYLDLAIQENRYNYISPDFRIDASTCLFPDYTWFAEGVDHFDFPKSVDYLLLAICRYDGQMDVNSDTRFPQYMKYSGEGNLATWAGGLYLNYSTDKLAGVLRKIIYVTLGVLERIKSVAIAIMNLY